MLMYITTCSIIYLFYLMENYHMSIYKYGILDRIPIGIV